jgi:CRISPR-associated protein Cas2
VSMTVLVTRNASARVRGFLASVMLELAPGVYSFPRVSPAVRLRVWEVLKGWHSHEPESSIVMIWQEREQPGGQAVATLGTPPIDLVEVDGLILTRRHSRARREEAP